jgi:hypothetical protein
MSNPTALRGPAFNKNEKVAGKAQINRQSSNSKTQSPKTKNVCAFGSLKFGLCLGFVFFVLCDLSGLWALCFVFWVLKTNEHRFDIRILTFVIDVPAPHLRWALGFDFLSLVQNYNFPPNSLPFSSIHYRISSSGF